MNAFQVYDLAMCCSTGVCGPEVDHKLVRFAADLKWLQAQGVEVERFNLSQSPAAFVENEQVKQALTEKGEEALPMVIGSGRVLSSGRYPERDELAAWAGVAQAEASIYSAAVNELVAIGAAIAANCEPCLKYHYRAAQQLGVSKADMARAVETGGEGQGLTAPGRPEAG
jgi:AhpD family alkylhydroperoxidase